MECVRYLFNEDPVRLEMQMPRAKSNESRPKGVEGKGLTNEEKVALRMYVQDTYLGLEEEKEEEKEGEKEGEKEEEEAEEEAEETQKSTTESSDLSSNIFGNRDDEDLWAEAVSIANSLTERKSEEEERKRKEEEEGKSKEEERKRKEEEAAATERRLACECGICCTCWQCQWWVPVDEVDKKEEEVKEERVQKMLGERFSTPVSKIETNDDIFEDEDEENEENEPPMVIHLAKKVNNYSLTLTSSLSVVPFTSRNVKPLFLFPLTL